MRRIFLPVMKIMQDNPFLFGISIGINANSFQWEELHRKHRKRKFHLMYDFKKFDKSHADHILSEFARIFMAMATAIFPADYTVCGHPWQVLAAAGLSLMIFPIFNVRDTIIMVKGSLGSGVFCTAVANSVIQQIILTMLWETFCLEYPQYLVDGEPKFNVYNDSDKYGDDGMLSTEAEEFNLEWIATTAERKWGLIITDPNKNDVYPKSFPVDTWSYLKRGFRTENGMILAPLEKESVLKTLNWWVPDDTMSEKDAMMRRCDEAMSNYAGHPLEDWQELADVVHAGMAKVYGAAPFGTYFPDRATVLRNLQQHMVSRRPTTDLAWAAQKDPIEFAWNFWGKTKFTSV
jgi:hypothetical protein